MARLAMVYEALGEIFLNKQKYWEALNVFQTAMAYDSTRARTYVGLGISILKHDMIPRLP